MEYHDKVLKCSECGAEFVFTAGEQMFFADKGFKNEPKRCKACKAKRAEGGGGGGGGLRLPARNVAKKQRFPSGQPKGARCSAGNASKRGDRWEQLRRNSTIQS
jgi:DNA-directed RNA polymerase subunit RPC12/RpoP